MLFKRLWSYFEFQNLKTKFSKTIFPYLAILFRTLCSLSVRSHFFCRSLFFSFGKNKLIKNFWTWEDFCFRNYCALMGRVPHRIDGALRGARELRLFTERPPPNQSLSGFSTRNQGRTWENYNYMDFHNF